ncbi:MAG: DUF3267 domain-containing protein [Oscillospiraceae bacterium]|nr:DUF3267 domain-containing protein [Oscillospiraceae bacterium]
MKLHYMGKYDLNPDNLPHGEHKEGCVKFKEAEDSKKLAFWANIAAFAIMLVLAVPTCLRLEDRIFDHFLAIYLGIIVSMLVLFPHEILHAICFKEDVYLYTNWRQGMLFVIGPEDMSKGRFVFMSMLPNLVFGFLPYILGMIFASPFLLALGTLTVGMGAGDYYNVFNALTQMPKGARTYLYKFNSYWYMP